MAQGSITIVGCGPGAPSYVTPQARDAAHRADLLIGSTRLLELFADAPGDKVAIGASVRKAIAAIEARGEKNVAVLVSGDPGVFSLAKSVVERFGNETCEVIPGVSSVQMAFARAGLGWHDAVILSAHKDNPEVDSSLLSEYDKIAVLGGREKSLPWIARLAETLEGERDVIVCENLTLADEKVRPATIEGLKTMKVSTMTVVLLIRKDAVR